MNSEAGEFGHRLILRAIVSMAAADGSLDAAERRTISDIYNKVTKEDLPAEHISSVGEEYLSNASLISDELKACCNELDRSTKETIVRGCYMVLLADGHVAAEERKRLGDIARSLKLKEIHYKMILEDVEAELGGE